MNLCYCLRKVNCPNITYECSWSVLTSISLSREVSFLKVPASDLTALGRQTNRQRQKDGPWSACQLRWLCSGPVSTKNQASPKPDCCLWLSGPWRWCAGWHPDFINLGQKALSPKGQWVSKTLFSHPLLVCSPLSSEVWTVAVQMSYRKSIKMVRISV